jgi:hypothetical protein
MNIPGSLLGCEITHPIHPLLVMTAHPVDGYPVGTAEQVKKK